MNKQEFQIIIKETNKIYKIKKINAIYYDFENALNNWKKIKKFFKKELFIRWIVDDEIIDLNPLNVIYDTETKEILEYERAIIKKETIKSIIKELITEEEIKNLKDIDTKDVENEWNLIDNMYKIFDIDTVSKLNPSEEDIQIDDNLPIKSYSEIIENNNIDISYILNILKYINNELININKSKINININYIFDRKKEYLIYICKILINKINKINLQYKKINFEHYL